MFVLSFFPFSGLLDGIEYDPLCGSLLASTILLLIALGWLG